MIPVEIDLVYSIKARDPYVLEAYFHEYFKEQNLRGEWFEITAGDIEQALIDLPEVMHIYLAESLCTKSGFCVKMVPLGTLAAN